MHLHGKRKRVCLPSHGEGANKLRMELAMDYFRCAIAYIVHGRVSITIQHKAREHNAFYKRTAYFKAVYVHG